MELEEWLKKYDVKKMVMDDLKNHLDMYRRENEQDFNKKFKNNDFNKVRYEYHNAGYVISESRGYAYITSKVRLYYGEYLIGEYQADYNLDDGHLEDEVLCWDEITFERVL